MSRENVDDVRDKEGSDVPHANADDDRSITEGAKKCDKNRETAMPTLEQEEEVIKKKYGGLLPKKQPLISKDHERAFFDSADWALGKQGQKTKGPLEALRPKLQPTPHQHVRRSSYAPADDEKDVGDNVVSPKEAKQAEDNKNLGTGDNKNVDTPNS